MSANHEIQHKVYGQKEQVIEYLRPFFQQHTEKGAPRKVEVYRTPGTFAHEYLMGNLSVEQVVETVKKHPDACFCCMDERVKAKGRVTSHIGCGAAAIVADLVRTQPELRAKYEAVVGKDTTQRLLDVLAAAEGENLGLAKDAFGAEWSKAIARLAGVEDSYEHLEIDDMHHYASMAVLDMSGNLMVNTDGQVGERAFFISNPKKVVDGMKGEEARKIAYSTLIDYGLLALQIARGAHSSLPQSEVFTIAIVRNERVDQPLWDRLWKEKTQALEASWKAAQEKKPVAERAALNYRVEILTESDLTESETAVR